MEVPDGCRCLGVEMYCPEGAPGEAEAAGEVLGGSRFACMLVHVVVDEQLEVDREVVAEGRIWPRFLILPRM